jgi:hypothetical protein
MGVGVITEEEINEASITFLRKRDSVASAVEQITDDLHTLSKKVFGNAHAPFTDEAGDVRSGCRELGADKGVRADNDEIISGDGRKTPVVRLGNPGVRAIAGPCEKHV